MPPDRATPTVASPGAGCSAPPGPGLAGLGGRGGRGGVRRQRAGGGASRRRSAVDRTYPFYGEHQAGIVTPAQDRLHFAAFDVITDVPRRADRAAAGLDRRRRPDDPGRWAPGEIGPTSGPYDAPPDDTGEAIGLPPSGLTITFGFGPTPVPRRPARTGSGSPTGSPTALRRLPHFPADNLDPAKSDGDLCVQACADDPQVAVHAIRNLARIALRPRRRSAGRSSGFGRTSSTSTSQATPRNLFGFKDGTANLKAEEPDCIDEHVWVPTGADDAADWLAGGSLPGGPPDQHDHRDLGPAVAAASRRRVIGRTKAEGAPLSGGVGVQRARLRAARARRRAR